MGRGTGVGALAVVAARGRPVTTAEGRLVEVVAPLAALLPEGGVRRGSTVAVGAGAVGGATSLAMGLVAAASAAGGWCAAVGLGDLGLAAAAAMGVALDRFALVPAPGPQWPVVVAALLESAEVVVVRPPGRVRPGDARRLGARARERGSVLVTLDPPGPRAGIWPEAADLRLAVTGSRWSGLGAGHGHLTGREVEVTVSGRRVAARLRRGRLLLPGPSGGVEAVVTDGAVDRSTTPWCGAIDRGAGDGTAVPVPVPVCSGVVAASASAAAVLAAATEAAAVRRAGRHPVPVARAG